MWARFEVRVEFLNRLCAGLPADPEVFRRMLDAKKPKYQPPGTKSIQEIAEEFTRETLGALPEKEEDGGNGDERVIHVFERRTVPGREGKALVVGMRTFRAHVKDMATTLSSLVVGKVEKERSFAVKAKAAMYYPPEIEWVPILQADGSPFVEPTGIVWDKPIHMQTPRGPRSALKSYEYVDAATVVFPLYVLQTVGGKLVVGEQDLKYVFQYGGVHGYGPERGDGMGKYVATVTPLPD